MFKGKTKDQKGFTVIEALVGVGLVSMVVMSLYMTIFQAVRLMGDSKQKIGAVALATERMEMIRNLEYEDIGTQSWVPEGPFAQEETLEKNGFPYLVRTSIEYVDDPFDGTGTDDDVENDYKQARVEVVWTSGENERSVLFVSNFVPDGLESDVGGGVLSVNVSTPVGDPISNVRVDVDSVDENPAIHGYSTTDSSGNVRLPGMPEQEYKITISKEDYETVETHPNPPDSSFTPIDANVYVTGVTMKSFFIEKTAALNIKAEEVSEGTGIQGIDVDLLGGRLIGTDPDTFSFDDTETTDSSGEISLSGLSPGDYDITNFASLGNAQYSLVGSDSDFPRELFSEDNIDVNLLFAETQTDSLFVTAVDNDTEEPVVGAAITVTGSSFNQSSVTDSRGQAYFPVSEDPPVTMDPGSYTVEIQATGYQNYSESVSVDDLTQHEARLSN